MTTHSIKVLISALEIVGPAAMSVSYDRDCFGKDALVLVYDRTVSRNFSAPLSKVLLDRLVHCPGHASFEISQAQFEFLVEIAQPVFRALLATVTPGVVKVKE